MSKYEAGTNREGLNCVIGPGYGLGHNAHTLNPQLSCKSKEEAERAAAIANIAYEVAYKQAQYDMRLSMGLMT